MRPLTAQTAALICIDYQEKLLPKMVDSEKIRDKALVMVETAKALGLPIVATEQYPKGLGRTVPEIRDALENVEFIEKIDFNCFRNKTFPERLYRMGRENLLISGIEAHICVTQTVLEALNRGYKVYLIEDTISSRATEDREIAFKRMERAGAIPSSVEMLIYELLVKAGTPEFKAVLRLIK